MAEPIIATAGLLLLQIPPNAGSDKVTVPPVQTCVVPVTGKGDELTVTAYVDKHPDPKE